VADKERAQAALAPGRAAAALRPPARTMGEHFRRTVELAWPVMLARAGILVMAAVDTIMTGRVGAAELAAYGLGNVPFVVFLLFGVGLLTGAVPLIAQADGAGRTADCGRYWRLSLRTALVFGLLGFLALVFAAPFLRAVGVEAELAAHGGRVALWFGLGLPFVLMHTASALFMEAIGRPLPGMILMAAANALNAGLNALLLYGWFGLPEMGAEGAALATTLARIFLCVGLGLVVLRFADAERYGVHRRVGAAFAAWRRLLGIGLPFALAQAAETTSFQAVSIFAAWLGTAELAAYHALNNMLALIFMLSLGIATAVSVRVGNAVGRGDAAGRGLAAWVGVLLTLALTVLIAPLLIGGRELAAAVYLQEPEVRALAAAALPFLVLVLVFDGLQVVLLGALRGASDVWQPTLRLLAGCWLVLVPVAWLLGVRLGLALPGLLTAIAIGLLVVAILLWLRLRRVLARPIRAL
jgi:multidrug resistance protein, MATE family